MTKSSVAKPSVVRRALVSVYNKAGIAEFCRALVAEFGVEVLSTGGTARMLVEHRVPVTLVEDVTGSGEMLDGRVKTLHPAIHAAILADRDNGEHMRQLRAAGITPIDMVVVNLYPFEATVTHRDCTFEQAIEMIDVGGPCMLRAAAKNHRHVLAVHDPSVYDAVLEAFREDSVDELASLRAGLARSAFERTCAYDRCVADYLAKSISQLQGIRGSARVKARGSQVLGARSETFGATPARASEEAFEWPVLGESRPLRYGENPHQRGALRLIPAEAGTDGGSEAVIAVAPFDRGMSFNNYVDADAALALCKEWTWAVADGARTGDWLRNPPRRCCTLIKHTNPCGFGVDDDPVEAYRKAYLGDPSAAMGGILAVNFTIDAPFASALMETYDRWGKQARASAFFVEVLVAPRIDTEAKEIIRTGKPWGRRVRIVEVGDLSGGPDVHRPESKRVSGGVLFQTRDLVGVNADQWQIVTRRAPSKQERADLCLAWLVCKHTRSNAISICRDGMLLGNGAGQMSRVMSCRLATWSADQNGHAAKWHGSVAAADAFFPFRDGPDVLIDAGVRAIIQPGGSKRDDETIAACNERDVVMVMTGTRHFRH